MHKISSDLLGKSFEQQEWFSRIPESMKFSEMGSPILCNNGKEFHHHKMATDSMQSAPWVAIMGLLLESSVASHLSLATRMCKGVTGVENGKKLSKEGLAGEEEEQALWERVVRACTESPHFSASLFPFSPQSCTNYRTSVRRPTVEQEAYSVVRGFKFPYPSQAPPFWIQYILLHGLCRLLHGY